MRTSSSKITPALVDYVYFQDVRVHVCVSYTYAHTHIHTHLHMCVSHIYAHTHMHTHLQATTILHVHVHMHNTSKKSGKRRGTPSTVASIATGVKCGFSTTRGAGEGE